MPNECCGPVDVGAMYCVSIVPGDETYDQSGPMPPYVPVNTPDATFMQDPIVSVMPDSSTTTGGESTYVHDVGVGDTTISTYGSVERRLPMPVMHDGMMSLARLYHSMLIVDGSYPAWEGSGTHLKALPGNELPVPDMSGAGLVSPEMVQPRPGTMPGLYILQVGDFFYQYGGPLETGANPQTTAVYDSTGAGNGGGGGGDGGVDDKGKKPSPLPTMIYKYTSNLSGAQLWHDASANRVEVRHVDGTVASFEQFGPYAVGQVPINRQMWRISYVRDPYDNTATYP